MMRQLHWGLKAEFPYTKVFILGIILTVLGSACVVVSVVGIVKLAWGYYVSTGMWGGVVITISGLAAMYAARARTSRSVRLYFLLSIMTCMVSFAMLVLSAGGLTYKSNFYQSVRLDTGRHQITLFLHGSVLGASVLSLACNVLSVIVCCKFITREKERPEESFKLRRQRHRFSDSNAVYRTGSLRGGSGTVRSSASSRTPLFGSDRSHKHSRQDSDFNTCLKAPGDRSSSRRDSERSRGSSRSRHSHHRQSSSVSQQSRQSTAMEAEITTVLLRDTHPGNSLSGHREGMSSHSPTDDRDSQADTITDNVSVQLVFDPDEEPLPPYEESRPPMVSDDIEESDTETVDGNSNVVVPSSLPLNIPVTHLIGGDRQTQSLQRQPPPSGSSHTRTSQQIRLGRNEDNSGAMHRTNSTPNSPDVNNSDVRDNRINLMRMTLTGGRTRNTVSPTHGQGDLSHAHPPDDRSASPEICALTGAGMAPVGAVQSIVGINSSTLASCVPQLNHSAGSSDTSLLGDVLAPGQNPSSFRSLSGPTHPLSSESPSALPAGIRSPNSAFRPVGRRVVPLSQASPSHSVPLHNFFSPISSPASAHHTVYSPVASPSAVPRFSSSPTSPHHVNNTASSSESLTRGGSAQSLSWKKIPLPTSHNHSNRTSSVPSKEVISKNIPGSAVPLQREQVKDQDTQSHSLPRQSSRDADRGVTFSSSKDFDSRTKTSFVPISAVSRVSGSQFATVPVRRSQEASVSLSDRHHAPRHSVDSSAAIGSRSAFISRQPGPVSNQPSVDSHLVSEGNSSGPVRLSNQPAPVGSRGVAVSKHTAITGSHTAASREQLTQQDPGRRSAGCQATEEDGGISSSMDRTHRWVMGTLPSTMGNRFQGTTRNIAHIHSGAAPGSRSALSAVTKSGGRAHGIWERPNKTAAQVPASVSSPAVTLSQPIVPHSAVSVAVDLSSPTHKGSSFSRLPRYQPQPEPREQPAQYSEPHRSYHQQQPQHAQMRQPVPQPIPQPAVLQHLVQQQPVQQRQSVQQQPVQQQPVQQQPVQQQPVQQRQSVQQQPVQQRQSVQQQPVQQRQSVQQHPVQQRQPVPLGQSAQQQRLEDGTAREDSDQQGKPLFSLLL